MVHVQQDLRREVGRARAARRKLALGERGLRTGRDARVHLRADVIGGGGAHHGTEGGRGIGRVAEHVLAGQRDRAGDEVVV